MVADKASQPISRDEFKIAIVCTEPPEYDTVCLLFDEFWDTDGDSFGRARGDPNTYTTGCMGKYNIVVVLLCSSGKANAAGAAASLRSSYPCIELLLLTGVCEGVPDANGEELLLGDVVVSETVIQYDLGTQHVVGFKEKDTLEDRHGRANKNIRNFIANVKTEVGYQRIEERTAAFLEQIQGRTSETKYQRRLKTAIYMYPGSANDILFESTHCHRHYNSSQCVCAGYKPDEGFYAVCDDAANLSCEQTGCELSSVKARDRIRQKNLLENGGELKSAQIPAIFFGCFGSGDTVFKSGVHRDSLAKTHGIIAFENEGAGVWDELPCILVKGVSKYGDGHKIRKCAEWQSFAAATAASVARALVERYPQTDKPPVTKLKADKLLTELQENKACLDALFITNPEDDKQRIEDTKGGLLLDAYIWIIRNEEFMQWLDDPETRLLWVKGDPGKGKTMLLCGIINELKTTSPRGNIYYFLCQATDDRLNNASAILRGLLHMMVVQQPSLISYVRHEYDKSGKSAFEGVNSWVILSRIFEQMLRDDALKEPVFIIDAIDECVTYSAQLLKIIVRSSSSSQVKWLVSSRNEADVQEALAAAENKSSVSLELNAKSVSTAITMFVQHKVQLLANKKGYKQPTRDKIERYLSDNANGTFLWVSLVCALLEKVPRSDPLPKSADFPPGLDQLYERMISRVCDLSISGISRKVLAITTVAHRPLTNEELIHFVNIDHRNDIMPPFEYDWEDILGHCGSFLTMRNDTIYFVHQSAKDFLVKEGSQRLFPDGIEYIHREVLEASITLMRNMLRNDMYNLVDPAFSIDYHTQHALSDDPLVPIKYGCIYWINHFEQSIPKVETDTHNSSKSHELIYAFLKDKFIHWVEALSLLRGIFDGIDGMQRLEQLVADSGTPGLVDFVWDARKFIQAFGNVVADYPLQVYVSALIFSPTQSITRRQFKEEAPKWIQPLPSVEAKWALSSRTYGSNRRIVDLAVSCCGTWIASSYNEADIIIWETYSGRTIRNLDAASGGLKRYRHGLGSLFGTLVCFSPWNREELVSSCCWYLNWFQLVVWDVTTGKISQHLRINENVESISYLNSTPNMLGYFSRKPSLVDTLTWTLVASIWNTKTGQIIKRIQLQELSSRPGFPIFSPTDDSKIVWCKDNSVNVINIDTGSTLPPLLTDNEGYIKNIRFSPDGSLLALVNHMRVAGRLPDTSSSSPFDVIILSDASSADTKRTFPTEALIFDIAFSPDGKLLAVATLEGIELLSTFSGKCLRKIIMRSRRLLFSSDGSKLFSTFESAVSIVDIGQESFMETSSGDNSLDKKTIQKRHESLSPSGRLVVSVLTNRVIEVTEIGSTNSTPFLRTLETHSTQFLEVLGPIQKDDVKLLFSPDSKKLAIISRHGFILWHIFSEPARTIFMWKSPSLSIDFNNKSVFSLDSKHLATTMPKHGDFSVYVQVWDTDSGKCLMSKCAKIVTDKNYHIGLSPANGRLAISYFDKDMEITVKVWDIASNLTIRKVVLRGRDLCRNFRPSFPDAGSCGWPNEEDQEHEEAPEVVEEQRNVMLARDFCTIREARFIEDDHLTLDLPLLKTPINQTVGLRVVLRVISDQKLAAESSNRLRFREAKIYDLDSEQTWIRFNGKRLVWIPLQYRTEAILNERNRVIISHFRGSYSIIQFSHTELAKQISSPHTSIMRNKFCIPDIKAFTSLRQLGKGWKVVYRDMNVPNNESMYSKETNGEGILEDDFMEYHFDDMIMYEAESVDASGFTHSSVTEHISKVLDDKMMREAESVVDARSTSEVAHEDATEHDSYWKWTIFGF